MGNASEPETMDFLLAKICHLHYVRAHALLESIGLYRGQPPLLHALWEQEGLSHTQLSERLQISPATTTKMVQRMEKAGFLQRRPDPSDERVSRVYLTEAGRGVRLQVQGVWDRMEAETFQGLSDEERAALRRFLLKIRQNLESVTV
jgi:DNA-binding MarR family transcriptional regulator